jgi:hypothetical protein
MKRTAISVLLLIILGWLLYLLWWKFWQEKKVMPVQIQQTSKVENLLKQGTSDVAQSEKSADVAIDNIEWYDYEWGWEYRQFFPQTVKEWLANRKDVVLYFYADRDPTDKALDLDLQKKKDRIPKNMLIVKVDYTANAKIREAFKINQQNTLVWLNPEWTEITRRSIWITSLSQIVRVQP